MIELLHLAIGIIVVEAITEILVDSTLFAPLRDWLHKHEVPFLSPIFSCGYCMSVWVSMAVCLTISIETINIAVVDKTILVFLLHRSSNVFHEYINRILNKLPIILCFNTFELEDIPDTIGEDDE